MRYVHAASDLGEAVAGLDGGARQLKLHAAQQRQRKQTFVSRRIDVAVVAERDVDVA